MENNTSYTIALIYNLKKDSSQKKIVDEDAEYDSIETIYAIKTVLEKYKQKVILLEANESILPFLKPSCVDIAFNISEGLNGRARESFIPSILTNLKVPFVGSDETTLAIGLDKSLCKKIISYHKIKTPPFILVHPGQKEWEFNMSFPVIVKPNAEGSGKGIMESSLTNSLSELTYQVNKMFDVYKQPIIIEKFIEGREFTVSIIGNEPELTILTPMEIVFENKQNNNFCSYSLRRQYDKLVKFECPSTLSEKKIEEIKSISLSIYNSLECKDFARIDFRLDSKTNDFNFIEINPLPGLAPNHSNLPTNAEFDGISYSNLIISLLNSSLRRYDMLPIPI